MDDDSLLWDGFYGFEYSYLDEYNDPPKRSCKILYILIIVFVFFSTAPLLFQEEVVCVKPDGFNLTSLHMVALVNVKKRLPIPLIASVGFKVQMNDMEIASAPDQIPEVQSTTASLDKIAIHFTVNVKHLFAKELIDLCFNKQKLKVETHVYLLVPYLSWTRVQYVGC